MWKQHLFLLVLLKLFQFAVSQTESCSKSVTVGDPDFKKHEQHLDDISGVLFVVSSDMYRFPCCGIVHAVKTHIVKNGVVTFLVWRPSGETDKYKIAAKFNIDVTTAPKSGSNLPSGSLLLQVVPGDLMGWYVSGESSIPYDDGDIEGHVAYLSVTEEPDLGDIIDFSDATKETGRIYAIAGSMLQDTIPPEFKGTPSDVKVKSNTEIGTQVVKIHLFDPQLQDVDVSINSNPYFDIGDDERSVVLRSKPDPGIYTIVLTSKSPCGLSSTTSITVTVTEKDEDDEPNVDDTVPTTSVQEDDTETTIVTVTEGPPENRTLDAYLLSPEESRSSLWMVLAGLSTSIVLLCFGLVVCRYAWVLYGGRFRSETATEAEKKPVPDKNSDPEAVDGGSGPGNVETKQNTYNELVAAGDKKG